MNHHQNELVLLTGTKETRKTLARQLDEIIGDFVTIEDYSLEEGVPQRILHRLVILSTHLITSEEVAPYLGEGCSVITARRTVNYQSIDQLFWLPPQTRVLYVNDFQETAVEGVETLLRLGIDHITYIPWYPGAPLDHLPEIAVTPGEVERVPASVKQVIDIGARLIDISTVLEILERFQLTEKRARDVSEKYVRTIIKLSKRLSQLSLESRELNQYLNHVLDGVNDGIMAVNRSGEVTVFNGILGEMLKVSPQRALGRHLREVLPDRDFLSFVFGSETEEEDRWFRLKGTEVIAHRFPMRTDRSVVVTLKNARESIAIEQTRRREWIKRGYLAKYTLDHIIGTSKRLEETKRVAQKIARTDLTVLIQGESGTGKELFASAIHHESIRSQGPYVAVNFSALSEDLVESELFGYEEGAFTGAKKGGKPGLFEQADGGTLFLDEIGDVSLKLQARLLRVLQEKEVMRVGGSRIIPVDVRVIAATNKNLETMIEEGRFREDLYYRLKVLSLPLPALRERKEDILPLARHFLQGVGVSVEHVEPQVWERMIRHPWYGNVRELKNGVDYMHAVSDGEKITCRDLPESVLRKERAPSLESSVIEVGVTEEEEWVFILSQIQYQREQGGSAGRARIAAASRQWKRPLSPQQVRKRLDRLEREGLVVKGRGPGGSQLTSLGVAFLEQKRSTLGTVDRSDDG